MKLLVIDTTKQNSHIVLINNDVVSNVIIDVKSKVSESLLPNIERLLTSNNISLHDVDAFGVVVGPGSFTGVRVGVATIKAFAQVLDKPVIALNSFEVVQGVVTDGRMCLKCTNTSMYYADYHNSSVSHMGVLENDLLKEDNIYQLENEIVLDGVKSSIVTNYPQILCDAFVSAYNKSAFQPFNIVEPLYLQLSQAELALKKKETNK